MIGRWGAWNGRCHERVWRYPPHIDALLCQPLKERLRQVLVRVDAVGKEDAQRPRLPAPPHTAAKHAHCESEHTEHNPGDEIGCGHLAGREHDTTLLHEGGVETV